MMDFVSIVMRRWKLGEFKSCSVCEELLDQCSYCASYVVDGERIYYEKLKDFGAIHDHEVRFINRIQNQRTTAFFYKGNLYIPSRQGRSVPLAIGLQWSAWQEQQSQIEQLKKRIAKVLDMLEGDLSYVEEDRRQNFDFLQMAMIRCLKDDIKALRGECE